MSRTAAAMILSASLLTAPSLASTPIVLDGVYAFTTVQMKDGKPVCTEKWVFNGKSMTIESGAEISHGTFRTEIDASGLAWLVILAGDTNGKSDCMGTSASDAPGPKKETRIYFFVRNSGSLALCAPPTRTSDGSDLTANCWGEATPVY